MIAKPSLLLSALMFVPLPLLATGEEINGFPRWEERVIHEWRGAVAEIDGRQAATGFRHEDVAQE